MSCDPPMNQKEIIASISFNKNKCLILVPFINYLYPDFSNFALFAPIIAMKD